MHVFSIPVSGRVVTAGILLFAGIVGCSGDGISEPDLGEGQGALISWQRVESLSQPDVADLGLPIPPTYAVAIDRLIYRTVDVDGGLVDASAAMIYPTDGSGPFPLASYQHGTIVRKSDVVSVGGSSIIDAFVGIAYASSGWVVVMPDYLGLGTSTGLHPYVHAESLASSVVDAIQAGKRLAEAESIGLTDQLFLVGYSEGGYATAAAQRFIQERSPDGLEITASAPMAGPYDLSGVMADVFVSSEPYNAVYFLPYFVLAYNEIYDLFDDVSDVFATPYDTTVPPLFDGSRSAGEIEAVLPDVPAEILDPDYLADFVARNDHPLRVALRENDLTGWRPTAPTRLYHCTEDDLVPFANSVTAAEKFTELGASDVELVELDFGDHGTCAAPALVLAKVWFDTLLEPAAPSATVGPVVASP